MKANERNIYAVSKKCQHKHYNKLIDSANMSSTQEQSALAVLTERANAVTNITSVCKRVALRGFSYCYQHIKLYEQDYQRYLYEQSITIKPSRANHDELYTLSMLLNKLMHSNGAYDNNDMMRVIALLRKDIDTRTAQRKIFTPDRYNEMIKRVAEMISTIVPDKLNECREQLNIISKDYLAEQG